MLLETMDGELINSAYLRSISPISGEDEKGRTVYGIAGYWAASAVPLTEEQDEPVELAYFNTEFKMRQEYERFLGAAAGGTTHLFRFNTLFR